MDYVAVVDKYFKDADPKAEPKDVNNLVNKSPYLKAIVKEGKNILSMAEVERLFLRLRQLSESDRDVLKGSLHHRVG